MCLWEDMWRCRAVRGLGIVMRRRKGEGNVLNQYISHSFDKGDNNERTVVEECDRKVSK